MCPALQSTRNSSNYCLPCATKTMRNLYKASDRGELNRKTSFPVDRSSGFAAQNARNSARGRMVEWTNLITLHYPGYGSLPKILKRPDI